jgi:hypothetical protein
VSTTTKAKNLDRQVQMLWRHIKPKSVTQPTRLHINTIDDDLWWSDSYVMVKADDAFLLLIDSYNLPAEPMMCSVGRTITRTGNVTGDLAGLLEKYAPRGGNVDVAPLTVDGERLTITFRGRRVELWSTDEHTVTHRVRADFTSLPERNPGTWRTKRGDTNALIHLDMDKNPDALVMPIRGSDVDLSGVLG